MESSDSSSVTETTMDNMGNCRADSRFPPSQWETVLLCNDVSHWRGANLESGLFKLYHRDTLATDAIAIKQNTAKRCADIIELNMVRLCIKHLLLGMIKYVTCLQSC